MAPRTGRYLVFALGIALVVSLWRAVLVEHQKRDLAAAYAKTQQILAQIERERAHLNTELSGARQTIEEQTGDLSHLKTQLREAEDQLHETSMQLTSLQRDHEQLQAQHASLETQMESLKSEKQSLEAKLSSLKDLRLAIRDVKRKVWEQRFAAWRARIEAQKEIDQQQLASGNRGYVVKNGATTLGASPRLHVHVLEPQSE